MKQPLDRITNDLGVQRLVLGDYETSHQVNDSQIRVSLRVLDPSGGSEPLAFNETGHENDIFGLSDRIARDLRAGASRLVKLVLLPGLSCLPLCPITWPVPLTSMGCKSWGSSTRSPRAIFSRQPSRTIPNRPFRTSRSRKLGKFLDTTKTHLMKQSLGNRRRRNSPCRNNGQSSAASLSSKEVTGMTQ